MWNSRLLTIVLIALIVLFANHVAFRALEGSRIDLTEDGLYSLSDGSQEILRRMTEEGVKPIEIDLYFSETTGKTLPRFIKNFVTYERYLRSLLKEYERASEGRIKVRFIDPVTDSDEAEDALDFRLDGKAINQEGDLFFFGLVFQTQTGSRDAIEFLWPNQQETIEYEISKKIHSLLWPSGKTIGILSSLEVFGGAANPYLAQMLAAQGRTPREKWIAVQVLEESYEVRPIDAGAEHISPDEFDLVVVIHPKDLSTKVLWALDEWVVRGGNTMVFLDPYALDDLEGSFFEQYIVFWKRLMRGDFGPSFSQFPTPVTTLIRISMPWTIGLLLISISQSGGRWARGDRLRPSSSTSPSRNRIAMKPWTPRTRFSRESRACGFSLREPSSRQGRKARLRRCLSGRPKAVARWRSNLASETATPWPTPT